MSASENKIHNMRKIGLSVKKIAPGIFYSIRIILSWKYILVVLMFAI